MPSNIPMPPIRMRRTPPTLQQLPGRSARRFLASPLRSRLHARHLSRRALPNAKRALLHFLDSSVSAYHSFGGLRAHEFRRAISPCSLRKERGTMQPLQAALSSLRVLCPVFVSALSVPFRPNPAPAPHASLQCPQRLPLDSLPLAVHPPPATTARSTCRRTRSIAPG